MAKNDCTNCEAEIMLKLVDLQFDHDKLTRYVKLLERCVDVKYELNKELRDNNEILRNRLRYYEEKYDGRQE